MRRLFRPPLDKSVSEYLADKQTALNQESEPTAEVNRLWKNARSSRSFDHIESALRTMNGNNLHCMYCVANEGRHIDHFFPKTLFTEKTFDWENYLWACDGCNGSKLAKFPQNSAGAPLLLDPSKEDPRPHLPYSQSMGLYVTDEATEKGRTTIDVLKLNREFLQKARREAWHHVLRILRDLREAHLAADETAEADALEELRGPNLLNMLQELISLSRLDKEAFSDDVHSALDILLARADVAEYWCEPVP